MNCIFNNRLQDHTGEADRKHLILDPFLKVIFSAETDIHDIHIMIDQLDFLADGRILSGSMQLTAEKFSGVVDKNIGSFRPFHHGKLLTGI